MSIVKEQKTIVVATTNQGKLVEIRDILMKSFPSAVFKTLNALNCTIDVEEDRDTFAGNATKKADELSKFLDLPCVSDDSGLCINEYEGWPGVKTARFLGENTTSRQRNEYILERMKNIPKERRKASYVTCIAFAENGKETIIAEARVEGYITTELRGKNGFGFDEIFEIDGMTLAEMSSEEKNKLSARKKALVMLQQKIGQ